MKAKKLIIHVGYPKTGTTTFQQNVFPNLDDLVYLNDYISDTFLQRIFYSRENSFRLNLNFVHSEIREIIAMCGSDKVYLISNESFTSYGMFFRNNPEPNLYTVDPNTIANKLCIAFSECGFFENINILISLRNQLDLIKSMYAQTYSRFFKKYKQTNNFSRFVDYSLTNCENMILDTLQYDLVVHKYQKLFGESNVHVLLFEEFQNNTETFCNRISEIITVESNSIYELILLKDKKNQKALGNDRYLADTVSLADKIMLARKLVLKKQKFGITKSKLFALLSNIKIGEKEVRNVSYSRHQENRLKEVFCTGNALLEKRLRLPLRENGYPMNGK